MYFQKETYNIYICKWRLVLLLLQEIKCLLLALQKVAMLYFLSFFSRLINCELEYDSAVITFTFAKLGREAT